MPINLFENRKSPAICFRFRRQHTNSQPGMTTRITSYATVHATLPSIDAVFLKRLYTNSQIIIK